MPNLTLRIDGQDYGGWTSVRVTRGLERAAADFDLELTERWGDRDSAWPILPGKACQVLIDGNLLITGYVDSADPSFDGTSHRISAKGRSKTADIVDCSVVVYGPQLTGLSVDRIAARLAKPFGVGVRVDEGVSVGGAIDNVQVNQGESCFEVIERVCRMRALLVSDTPSGDILLTRASRRSASDSLEQGRNIVAASAGLDWSQRFSHYTVKGQTAGTDQLFGAEAAHIQGEAVDRRVTRFRPKLIVSEGLADPAKAQKRGEWEALRRAGNATKARVTVKSWTQESGRLWQPNELVRVRSAFLHIDATLLVGEVTYVLDDRGVRAELVLAPPEAFTPEPSPPSRGSALWSGLQTGRSDTPAVDISQQRTQ
jgi:prophage tail gpP-like protein